MASRPSPASPRVPSRFLLFRLFLREKNDPEPFYEKLAQRSLVSFPFPLDGARVLDLGAGRGIYSAALQAEGARVTAVDREPSDVRAASERGVSAVVCDGTNLPVADGAFDGVFCSNVLEHTPRSEPVFDEIERVVAPGGWAWVSWTNWYSPWGGHNIFPLHFLGPRLGPRVWRALFGQPTNNVPFDGLWPTYIGRTLADVRRRPHVEVVDAVPRYYPSQRWILRVPVLRELLTWNCLLLLRIDGRVEAAPRRSAA